jgi:ABC-2 type transport system permease protein
VVGWALLGVALATTGALFVTCGRLLGMPGMPGTQYARWLALAWVGGAASVACQLLVSLCVRNFAAPVGIAVAGGLVGFFSYAYDLGLACPYALVVMALNSNGGGALGAGEVMPFVALSACYTLVALGVAWLVIARRDVRTG